MREPGVARRRRIRGWRHGVSRRHGWFSGSATEESTRDSTPVRSEGYSTKRIRSIWHLAGVPASHPPPPHTHNTCHHTRSCPRPLLHHPFSITPLPTGYSSALSPPPSPFPQAAGVAIFAVYTHFSVSSTAVSASAAPHENSSFIDRSGPFQQRVPLEKSMVP